MARPRNPRMSHTHKRSGSTRVCVRYRKTLFCRFFKHTWGDRRSRHEIQVATAKRVDKRES